MRLSPSTAGDYWGWFNSRSYHHTGPVSTFYAMREALQIVADEGLEAMWARHLARHQQLWEGLSSMGLQPYVENDADRCA
jgi:alanine-glyoxylate transaminase/serine-glyoxylate transaminase/serine-pyruvate transaminase